MEFIQLILSSREYYFNKDSSSLKMEILGRFLTDDASFRTSSFKEFALNDWEESTNSNATAFEKKNGYIVLTDLHSEEKNSTELKLKVEQFLKLLDDWEENVLKRKPKEVIIKYENNEFTIETKD